MFQLDKEQITSSLKGSCLLDSLPRSYHNSSAYIMENLGRQRVAGLTAGGKREEFGFVIIYPPGRVAKVVQLSDFWQCPSLGFILLCIWDLFFVETLGLLCNSILENALIASWTFSIVKDGIWTM